MKNKQQLQNIGENLGFQSKIFFKSHDMSIRIQFFILTLPIILTLVSFYYDGCKLLDYISFLFSIIAIIYYCYYGRNAELYMNWGERYLVLYKDVENYFKSESSYDKEVLDKFIVKQNKLGLDNNKPTIHIFAKKWVDKTIEKEMTYGNEKTVWWKL